MNEDNTDKKDNVLVIGAGIAGIEASLLLAASDKHVYLVENTSYIGGNVIKYEEVFANMECSTCLIAPKQSDLLSHTNIELMTLTEIKEVKGTAGDFTVKVHKKARYVNEACIGCGMCYEPCPVDLTNEFEQGLSEMKAIYTVCPGALPNMPAIDMDHCLRGKGEDCQLCKEACMFEAIDYEQKDEDLELKVGTIIVATGFQTYDPTDAAEYGYKKLDDVYTSFDFERLFASNGPTEGQITLKNGGEPRSAAIIHCVGREKVGYCSAVCCLEALKFNHYLRTRFPDIELHELHQEMCIPEQVDRDFYKEAKEMGVDFQRSTDIVVKKGDGSKGNLTVEFNTENGKQNTVDVDIVILSPIILPRAGAGDLGKILGIARDVSGFFEEEDPEVASITTAKEGIFLAGCSQGPKTIQDSVAQAQAAAGKVISFSK